MVSFKPRWKYDTYHRNNYWFQMPGTFETQFRWHLKITKQISTVHTKSNVNKCKQIISDEDDFHSNDDKYSILCSTRETYDSPRKMEDWPSCVQFCPREIIYVPRNNTGLTGMVAKNTIPTGQYGSYVCIDQTLGVNRV